MFSHTNRHCASGVAGTWPSRVWGICPLMNSIRPAVWTSSALW